MEILNSGRIESETLLSPVIPYLQAISYRIVNSYGLYTLIQASLFYMAIGALIRLLIGEVSFLVFRIRIYIWLIVSCFVVVVPTVYVFPLMLTDSAPIFALIVFIGWVLLSNLKLCYKCVLFALLSLLCVGIRVNSIIMIVFLALLILMEAVISHKKPMHWMWGSMIIGCLMAVVLVKTLVPGNYNSSTLGMIWELVGDAATFGDEQLAEELGDMGDIDEGISRYGEPYLNSIVWDNNPPFPVMTVAGENAKKITALYVKEALRHPKRFVINKWHFVERTLGISEALISSTRGVHGVDDRTKGMGALDTELQGKLRNDFFKWTDGLSFLTLRPLWAFVLSLLTVFIVFRSGKLYRSYYLFLYLAAAYYSSFLINTQAFEFRYYAPTMYVFMCLIVSGVVNMMLFLYIKFSSYKHTNRDLSISKK